MSFDKCMHVCNHRPSQGTGHLSSLVHLCCHQPCPITTGPKQLSGSDLVYLFEGLRKWNPTAVTLWVCLAYFAGCAFEIRPCCCICQQFIPLRRSSFCLSIFFHVKNFLCFHKSMLVNFFPPLFFLVCKSFYFHFEEYIHCIYHSRFTTFFFKHSKNVSFLCLV